MVEQWVPLEIRGSTMVNHGHFIAQPWQEMVDNHGVTMVSTLSAMVEQWFFRRGGGGLEERSHAFSICKILMYT